MSETAAEQLRRILHLLPHVADGEEHALEEVAALAGTSPDTLLSDLTSLVERFDAPGGFVEGVQIYLGGGGVSVVSSHFLRPMRLTMPELCALELGLSVLRSSAAPDELGPIDRALERLRRTVAELPSNERHAELRHAELAFAGRAQHLAAVRSSVVARRKLSIVYRGGASAAPPAARVIRPYALIYASGTWYAAAFCERSEAMRFFRVDRIEGAQPLDATFEPPAELDIAALLASGRAFRAESAPAMTVRYSPRVARWIAEREGRPLAADGSLTLEHPVADPQWAVRHVLQYGPDAEVVAPAGIRRLVAERLRAMDVPAPTGGD